MNQPGLKSFRNASFVALSTIIATTAIAKPIAAQGPDPVHWSTSVRKSAVAVGDTVSIVVTATIDAGFHMYGLQQHDEGPSPLVVRVVDDAIVKANGAVRAPQAEKIAKSSFGVPVEWYSTKAVFTIPVRIAAAEGASTTARISIRFQSCSNSVCLLPQTIELTQPIALRARTAN